MAVLLSVPQVSKLQPRRDFPQQWRSRRNDLPSSVDDFFDDSGLRMLLWTV